MSNKIVILGQDYSAIFCMANSLKNYDVSIYERSDKENLIKRIFKRILLGKNIITLLRNVKEVEFVDTKIDDVKIIEKIIDKFKNHKDGKIILIPASDYMASVIDFNKELLDDRFVFPTIEGKNGEIINLMNKSLQKEIACKCGLDVIPEYLIAKEKGSFVIPDDIEYPVFIKPKVSYLGEKSIIRKCMDEEELKHFLKEIDEKYDCPMIVEKHVEIEKEYAMLGYSYSKEIFVPGIIEKIETAKGKSQGVTLKGKTMSLNNYKDLKCKIERFISTLNFDGLFDIELYEEKGKIYFNELNLRFGAEGYGITGSDVNLPELYIKNICGEEITDNLSIHEKTFLSDKANLDSYESGAITWKEYQDNAKNINFSFIKSTNKRIKCSFLRLELFGIIKRKIKGVK